MSAVLLPMQEGGTDPDWGAFDALLTRTVTAGLMPAVNMDTGYAHLLDAATKRRRARPHRDDRRRPVRGRRLRRGRGASTCASRGGTPVVVPNDRARRRRRRRLRGHRRGRSTASSASSSARCSTPPGASGTSPPTSEVLQIEPASGPSTRRSQREPEWERLRLRDAERPDFLVLTGNDLAIDMVMYGSDYLLGLSTFAPDLFAQRDKLWAAGDPALLRAERRAPAPRQRRLPAARARLPALGRDLPAAAGLDRHRRRRPIGVPRRPPLEGTCSASAASAWVSGDRATARRWPQVKRLGTADALPRPARRARRRPAVRRPARRSTPSPRRSAWPDRQAPNRFAILPMEGWDGTDDGRPTDLVRRRWARFGEQRRGADLGRRGVRRAPDGRANPHQLCLGPSSADDLAELRAPARAGPGRRPPAHALGPLGARRRDPGEPSRCSTPAARVTRLDRGRPRRAGRRLRRRGRARGARPASTSSTSRRATATSSTSCSAAPGSLEERARWLRTTIERVRAAAPGLASACGCRCSTSCPTAPAPTARASPRSTRDAVRLRRRRRARAARPRSTSTSCA